MAPQPYFRRVLLADDDDDDCALFKDALHEALDDVEVTCATSSEHLMQLLGDPALPLPDIIFIDVTMPSRNGIECLREIKEDRRLTPIPVIIISTSALPWAIEAAFELKAVFYIRKPDTFSKLKNVLQEVLSGDWKGADQRSKDHFLIDP